MKERHRISDSLFDAIYKAISENFNWIACKSDVFFLQKGELHFFRTPVEARAFADKENTAYAVTYASSVLAVYREVEGNQPTKKQMYSSKNKIIMNDKFLADLKNNLKFMGFGDKLSEGLESQMAKGSPNFQLTLETEINGKAFAAVLNFRKSDTTDRYFFNSYHATLGRKDGEVVDQAFYLKDGKGITAKEAFNLLDGRSVHKELTTKAGEPYRAWIQLDFDKKDKNNNHEVKQFHEAYGFDIKEALSKYAFTDLKDPAKEADLLKSLQKGNMQSVTFEKDGSVAKMFVEAAPQFKTVNLYDGEMKRVQKESISHYLSSDKAPGKEQVIKRDNDGPDKTKVNGKEVEGTKGLQSETGKSKPEKKSERQGEGVTKVAKEKGVRELLPQKEGRGNKKGMKVS